MGKKLFFGGLLWVFAAGIFSLLASAGAPFNGAVHGNIYGSLALAQSPLVPSVLTVSASGAPAGAKTVNVKEFGARGDGVSDDTKAVQAAIDAAPEGSTINFPRGTYLVGNFNVKNRSGLSFTGEGKNSIVKQKPGASRLATFSGARNIVISQLQFDANGVSAYGGVMFYASENVRIENNWYIDSAPKPIKSGREDRFAFVFGKGGAVSRDIQIRNNTIEDLQLEVDHAQRVVIDSNTVARAVRSAGIGIFTVGDNAVAEDFEITNNTIINPVGSGIAAVIDPATSRNCVFRRIRIAGNRITRKTTAAYGIRTGTIDNSKATTGNVFEDIAIENNRVLIEAGAPAPLPMIFANSSPTSGIVFQRLTVSGNEIINQGPTTNRYAVDLRQIQHSVVSENTVKGAGSGISLTGNLLGNELRDNVVEASNIAFQVGASLGENRSYGNKVLSTPQVKLRAYHLKASDAVQSPQ